MFEHVICFEWSQMKFCWSVLKESMCDWWHSKMIETKFLSRNLFSLNTANHIPIIANGNLLLSAMYHFLYVAWMHSINAHLFTSKNGSVGYGAVRITNSKCISIKRRFQIVFRAIRACHLSQKKKYIFIYYTKSTYYFCGRWKAENGTSMTHVIIINNICANRLLS